MYRFLCATVVLLTIAGCCGACGCGGGACSDCGPGFGWCWLGELGYWRNMDEKVTEHAARHRASVQLSSMTETTCDYRCGYSQAFADIALGSSGVTPALPARKYCGACFRTPEGHARVEQWFQGYEEGARDALATCGEHNYVLPSEYFDPKHGNCDANEPLPQISAAEPSHNWQQTLQAQAKVKPIPEKPLPVIRPASGQYYIPEPYVDTSKSFR